MAEHQPPSTSSLVVARRAGCSRLRLSQILTLAGVVTAPNLDLVTRLEASGVMSLHGSPLLPAAVLRSDRGCTGRVKGPSGLANLLGGPSFVCGWARPGRKDGCSAGNDMGQLLGRLSQVTSGRYLAARAATDR